MHESDLRHQWLAACTSAAAAAAAAASNAVAAVAVDQESGATGFAGAITRSGRSSDPAHATHLPFVIPPGHQSPDLAVAVVACLGGSLSAAAMSATVAVECAPGPMAGPADGALHHLPHPVIWDVQAASPCAAMDCLSRAVDHHKPYHRELQQWERQYHPRELQLLHQQQHEQLQHMQAQIQRGVFNVHLRRTQSLGTLAAWEGLLLQQHEQSQWQALGAGLQMHPRVVAPDQELQ